MDKAIAFTCANIWFAATWAVGDSLLGLATAFFGLLYFAAWAGMTYREKTEASNG